jgi:C1A family cysteine protease
MLQVSTESEKTRMFRPALLAAMVAMFFMAPSAGAQLTSEDITALQEQGRQEGWTFVVGENAATKYSLDQLCGLREPEDWQLMAPFDPMSGERDLPEAFDWRDSCDLPPIRNQGGCGSCWAFGTVGPLECNIKILDDVTEDLSEQWLVSCNHSGWSCSGGWFAHDYHCWDTDDCDSSGAVLEADFPYEAWNAPCGCPYPHPYRIESWAYIGTSYSVPSIPQIKEAIMEYGPVSVAIAVNGAFQAYNGGVFNGCSGSEINHAVVLVGWDDNQGSNGVWFLRNSWGPGWGEGGYMRIPYNCSLVGYAACYINYAGGVAFSADTTVGWAPFDVSLTATSGYDVDTWTWDLGDGDSAFVQSPMHTYQDPGFHTVKVEIVADSLVRSRVKPNYIKVLADSLLPTDAAGVPSATVEVPVYAHNFVPISTIKIPFEYSGSLDVSFDSFSTVGCRTEYFENQTYIHYNPAGKQITIRLVSSTSGTAPDLPAGEGDVVKLYFTLAGSATYEQTASLLLDGYSTHLPLFSGPYATYQPRVASGTISILIPRGDVDGVSGINVADLTYLVNYLFRSGSPPLPLPEAGDVNCDDHVNIADVTYLVNYLFRDGTAPSLCP